MSAFERLILLNEGEGPVGVLDVGCLLLNLLQGETMSLEWGLTEERNGLPHADLATLMARFCAVVGNDSQNRKGGLDASTTHDLDLWQQPVVGLSPEAVAAVERVPANMNLTQFWERLQTQDGERPRQPEWVVVDAEDKCLGLLDFPRAIAALAQNTRLVPRTPGFPEPPSEEPGTLSGIKAWPFGAVRPLGELLEEIPLPMKLQTSAGKVAIYNQAWRTYFDAFSEPETDPSGEVRTPSQLTFNREPDHLEHPDSDSLSLGLCPIPKESDRVWQFVKIPIGLALSERSPLLSGQDSPGDSSQGPELAAPESTGNQPPGSHPPVSASLPSQGSQTESLWLVLAQDVTVQQQVAKELAAKNADLMQMNRLKDEFLACISHELKTPLTAVLGLSSLLKERTLGPLTDRQARYAQMIYTSGRHLMNVVNDILDLTRIESGQMELILEPVSIPEVCDRAFDQAKQSHHPSDSPVHGSSSNAAITELEIPFTLELEPGLPSPVADELRLRQMLYNLLSNAIKFTANGGEIGLRVNRWEGWLAFTVWDTGIGIPAQKQHLIFQKFQQLENPMTRQFEGTGLGLALTQRLARAHGGDVTFISKEGVGSEFTLLLPPCPPQQTTTLTERVDPTKNRLILIVEAVPRYIDDLTERFNELGYRVAIARAGTEAVEKARRLQPRAIFLNLFLPMLSGWDVLTLLKSDPQTRHIPAIVMATEVDKERAIRAQCNGFLTLPVKGNSLEKTLEGLMQDPEEKSLATPPTTLTVLRLSPFDPEYRDLDGRSPQEHSNGLSDQLNGLLTSGLNPSASYHYRVLEADDLEQAELLARVWHLDAILLDPAPDLHDPSLFIQQFSQYPALAAVPLVTLDRQIALSASQVPGLTVFPYLKPIHSSDQADEAIWPNVTALFQAVEVAVGMSSKPAILAIDISILSQFPDRCSTLTPGVSKRSGSAESGRFPIDSTSTKHEWLQASIQYIQTAGFRCWMGRSWSEVWQQLQHHSVDLLLIYVPDSVPSQFPIDALNLLEQLPERPAILIVDRSLETSETDSPGEFRSSLKAIATQLLPPSLSMEELLDSINQALKI
ncbi:hybrid sensor histidine kinase/response regulator [Laspinema olomoucense]|uniref:hybrid sensor histidine kinase/response regulator n=1 Tax=Laspinema olomoucense TaxID=3231600 RepID=UPI0021BB7D2B|nr:hybrid sensor histidine kinase/response regulator [Laspinema sp. D3a]MCT7988428.1 hybrid sensor histidine kinase/response regulator [Laspinema sp. D3a]